MAITPIQVGSVSRIDRISGSQEQTKSLIQSTKQDRDESTNDLSLQAARQSSLLYQVVDKLVDKDDSSDNPVFDRLLSTKLATNSDFIGRLTTTVKPESNIIYMKNYAEQRGVEQSKLGGLIDIKEDG